MRGPTKTGSATCVVQVELVATEVEVGGSGTLILRYRYVLVQIACLGLIRKQALTLTLPPRSLLEEVVKVRSW